MSQMIFYVLFFFPPSLTYMVTVKCLGMENTSLKILQNVFFCVPSKQVTAYRFGTLLTKFSTIPLTTKLIILKQILKMYVVNVVCYNTHSWLDFLSEVKRICIDYDDVMMTVDASRDCWYVSSEGLKEKCMLKASITNLKLLKLRCW